jgi:hypothetical protein
MRLRFLPTKLHAKLLCFEILKVAEKGLEEALQAGTGAALFCYVGASVAGAEIC